MKLAELLDLLPDLEAEVQELLHQIPAGAVSTYGDLAVALGDDKTRSARWLGEYLTHHAHTANCVCHRVVRKNGDLGLYVTGDPQEKAELLISEGVSVDETGRVRQLNRFTHFHSSSPLKRLRDLQQQLVRQVKNLPVRKIPKTFGGIDVAYSRDGRACAAYVQLNARTLEPVYEQTLIRPVSFPYIPGYLTFRELPVMFELCLEVVRAGKMADVLFCDGNGRLHPWRAGIATCLGVLLNHPCIGVGKSLLCGSVVTAPHGSDESVPVDRLVMDGNQVIGAEIQSPRKTKPVYVSVGQLVTLSQAIEFTIQSISKHRIPEPVFLADRLTKRLKHR
ncbi:endonuclease V [Planctomicrobium sp. SH527]|uniref:endonuclease V n=1 Tax=Planctomicrobium sp. SH527 TaxID=3448123 RepID=UPI003F5BFB0A